MKIHKKILKKYIRHVLKEAYLKDDQGTYHIPRGLEPSVIFDKIKTEYEKQIPYHEEYSENLGQDPYGEIFHTFPVIRAGVNVIDDYIGPIMSARFQGYDYIIEPDDFKDMHIKNTNIRKEVLPRMDKTHFLKNPDPDAEKIPFKIEVIDGATLSTRYEPPVRLKPVPSGDETVPRVSLRNTAPLPRNDIDQTEEALGVYPKTEDIPEDYESNMTMNMDPRELGAFSAAERSKIASDSAGLDFGEYLPTGIDTGYDHFFQDLIPGEEDYMEKNYPGSMQQKYMKSYKK